MKLNKTQQQMLRTIFGSVDGSGNFSVSSPPKGMIIGKGSRSWAFAEELVSLGVAEIVQRGDFWQVQSSAWQKYGPQQSKTLCQVFAEEH